MLHICRHSHTLIEEQAGGTSPSYASGEGLACCWGVRCLGLWGRGSGLLAMWTALPHQRLLSASAAQAWSLPCCLLLSCNVCDSRKLLGPAANTFIAGDPHALLPGAVCAQHQPGLPEMLSASRAKLWQCSQADSLDAGRWQVLG